MFLLPLDRYTSEELEGLAKQLRGLAKIKEIQENHTEIVDIDLLTKKEVPCIMATTEDGELHRGNHFYMRNTLEVQWVKGAIVKQTKKLAKSFNVTTKNEITGRICHSSFS